MIRSPAKQIFQLNGKPIVWVGEAGVVAGRLALALRAPGPVRARALVVERGDLVAGLTGAEGDRVLATTAARST